MAKYVLSMPDDIINDFRKIYNNYEDIIGQMTKAGAEVVYNNVKSNLPEGIRNSRMMGCLRMTRAYRTPSDDGIAVKVGFWGYFLNENGQKTPAPLVANIFEYGRSGWHKFPKQPFFRKSFKPAQIEKAMLEAQKKASGGLLE